MVLPSFSFYVAPCRCGFKTEERNGEKNTPQKGLPSSENKKKWNRRRARTRKEISVRRNGIEKSSPRIVPIHRRLIFRHSIRFGRRVPHYRALTSAWNWNKLLENKTVVYAPRNSLRVRTEAREEAEVVQSECVRSTRIFNVFCWWGMMKRFVYG